jgi:hypothetical protein
MNVLRDFSRVLDFVLLGVNRGVPDHMSLWIKKIARLVLISGYCKNPKKFTVLN